MIQTVNVHDFRQAFIDHDRGEQFSYEALGLIFEYYEETEIDCGTPAELDVIATCCDIVEMTDDEVRTVYGLDDGVCLSDAICFLSGKTTIIGNTDDTVIFYQF